MTVFGTQMHFLQEFASRQLNRFQSFQFNKSVIEHMDQIGASFIIGFFVATIVLLLFLWRRMRINEKVAILSDSGKPRFRKRDKVMFYGRKMLRKVRSSLQGSGRTVRVKKRQLVMKFAKKLLRLKKEQPMQLQVKEPSQAFLEEDITHLELDGRLPAEVIYMLRNIRVFGFFDRPLFLELCKKIEFINVPKGKLLFCIGDDDDSMYIVQRGKLEVFASEPDGSELTLKEAIPGDPIFSLLSVMDVLSGHLAPFKTVSVRALDESTVLRLQIGVFRDLLEKYPELLVRVVQIIMVRLQRVTFTALHNYLGLTTQLVNPGCLSGHKRMTPNSDLQTSQLVPNASPPKASPSRPNRVSVIHQFQYSQSCPEYDDKGLKSVLKDMADMDLSGDDYSTLDVEKSQQKSLSQSPVKPSSMSMYGDSFKQKRRKSTVYCDDPILGLSDEEVLKLAVDGFMKEMCINDDTIIKEMVIVREHGAGVFLTHEDAYDEASLFYVLSGSLMVSQKNVDKEDESNLFAAYPGEIVGALAVITGEASAFTIRTRHPSRIGVISKEHTYEILAEYPKVVLQLAHSVVRRLSPFVRQIDFALDWGTYESGRAIYRQGDLSDNTFIVLSGRLRSVLTRQNGKKELVGEYGRGDLVGIVEVLTQTKRSTTVMAVRDTEIAKLPSGLLDVIKIKHPVIVTRLIHLLGHRLLGTLQKIDDSVAPESIGSRPSGSNFATVAVLAVNEEVPLQAFCMELKHALSAVGSSLYLTSDIVRKTLGTSALETSSEYRLCSWLGQQEDQHRIVLYQCDSTFTAWTQRCIRQADCILIIACADQQPTVGKLEQQLDSFA
ncbi:Neuropathy target esterase-like protein, partial [Leptotrombidium deliense]